MRPRSEHSLPCQQLRLNSWFQLSELLTAYNSCQSCHHIVYVIEFDVILYVHCFKKIWMLMNFIWRRQFQHIVLVTSIGKQNMLLYCWARHWQSTLLLLLFWKIGTTVLLPRGWSPSAPPWATLMAVLITLAWRFSLISSKALLDGSRCMPFPPLILWTASNRLLASPLQNSLRISSHDLSLHGPSQGACGRPTPLSSSRFCCWT